MIKKIHHYLYALLLSLTVVSATEPTVLNANISSDGTGQTYISSSTYKNKKVNYTIKDNLAIYEGDIILGTVDEAEVWREAKENTPTTNTALGNRKKWSKGIIPYTLDADVSPKTRTLINQAMRDIQTKANVSFVQRSKNNAHLYADYIHIVSTQPACWSEVGRTGGAQEMNLVDTCKLSGISHEFHHALGLFHHQTNKKSSITLLQELYGTAPVQKNTVSLKKSKSSTIAPSSITAPVNNQKIPAGQNFTLRWKNNGATLHYIYYYIHDAKNKFHRIFKGVVKGTMKTLNVPQGFTDAHVILVSYNNEKYLGRQRIKLLPLTATVKPSIITTPTMNTTVSSRQNITVKWKSYGADKHSISLGTVYNGMYGFKNIASNLSGTSKTIQMPTFFKSVDVILTSYKNGKRLGSSKVHLLPNKNAKGPTEFTSPVPKNIIDQPSVKAGNNLTITWENHGATKDFLLISAFDQQGYQRDLVREFVVGSGSKNITVPSYARSITAALYSLDGSNKSLGIARLYVKVIQ